MQEPTRREVLKGLGMLTTGAALPALCSANTLAPHNSHPGIRCGVQLNAFAIDPEVIQTFLETLAIVRQIGYQGFESSYLNVRKQFAAPEYARRSIERMGLTFFGVHIFMQTPEYDPATCVAPASVYEPVAHGGRALGAKYLILSGAPATDSKQLKQKIAGLNAAGAYAKRAGLGLAYHNHSAEFQSPVHEIEALYTQTDPSLVSFLFDAGHAFAGGVDVPAFVRTHSGRIVALHLRDYKNGRLVSLGQGTFPLAQVAATLKQIGWKGWVENEEEREDLSKTGLEVIVPAYKALKEAFSA